MGFDLHLTYAKAALVLIQIQVLVVSQLQYSRKYVSLSLRL